MVIMLLSVAFLTACAASAAAQVVNQTTCNGQTYVYQELAGYGFVPNDARDKFDTTIGGIGSAIAFDRSTWKKTATGYTGILYAQPDRGWYESLPMKAFLVCLTDSKSLTGTLRVCLPLRRMSEQLS